MTAVVADVEKLKRSFQNVEGSVQDLGAASRLTANRTDKLTGTFEGFQAKLGEVTEMLVQAEPTR